jgi:hypothetical protein
LNGTRVVDKAVIVDSTRVVYAARVGDYPCRVVVNYALIRDYPTGIVFESSAILNCYCNTRINGKSNAGINSPSFS